MRFMQTESVLQTKNRSEPAKNRFSVALLQIVSDAQRIKSLHLIFLNMKVCDLDLKVTGRGMDSTDYNFVRIIIIISNIN